MTLTALPNAAWNSYALAIMEALAATGDLEGRIA